MKKEIRQKRIKSAKVYFYDLSKLLIATLVIGSFAVPEKFNISVFIGGLIGAIASYLIAFILEGKEK